MARDYVRKTPAQNKKKNTNKNTTRNKKAARRFPWKAAIIALVLVVGLISLLSMLSNDPQPKPTKIHPIAIKDTSNTVKPKKEAIPPPPKEKWDYMQTLPQREIKVTAKEQEVPKIPYIMQCGAYKVESQAQERKANIAFQGLSSKVVKLKGSNWYRIILGPYTFKRDAVKEQHVLQRAKIEPCIIMKDTLK